MNKTFKIYSFGCRVNEAEKVQIELNLLKSGFSFDNMNPSVAIINTCAITSKAEREARQLIYRLKKKGNSTVIITGCSATYWKKTKTYQKLPIDLIIDNVNKKYLVDIVNKRYFSMNNPSELSSQKDNGIFSDKYLSSGRLMIKIQDGCHRFCSYCIVPYLRGPPNSQRIKNLVLRVKSYDNKINEVIFTAINTEAFGKDTGESLTRLIQTIIDKTTIPRISFGSIHPWSITPEFLKWYKNLKQKERFVHFFHIPLQSGTDKMLLLMKRAYTTDEFLTKLKSIHKINPFAFIATDVIVGFLDESDSDFQKTYDFLNKSPISKIHVFRFSKREKTAAYYMSKRLKEPTADDKKKRSRALIELSMRKYQAFLSKHIGKISTALFIGNVKDGFQEALLNNQIPVKIKTKNDMKSTIQNVLVQKLQDNTLIGKLV